MQDHQQPCQLLNDNEHDNVSQPLHKIWDFMVNIKMTDENNNDFCPF